MNTIPNDGPPTKPLTPEHAKDARLLIGWVPEDSACAGLAGPAAVPPYAAEICDRVQRAQQAVRDRPPIDRTHPVIFEAPASLTPYIGCSDLRVAGFMSTGFLSSTNGFCAR